MTVTFNMYTLLIQNSNTVHAYTFKFDEMYKVHKMHNYIQLDYTFTVNISIQYICILYNNYSYNINMHAFYIL